MKWYWKVRIYASNGLYWTAQVATEQNTREIDTIQDFYGRLTGCRMLLEGMSEEPYAGVSPLKEAFDGLWQVSRLKTGASANEA